MNFKLYNILISDWERNGWVVSDMTKFFSAENIFNVFEYNNDWKKNLVKKMSSCYGLNFVYSYILNILWSSNSFTLETGPSSKDTEKGQKLWSDTK